MFGWLRGKRSPQLPPLTLDQLVARGRERNADFARRRASALSPERVRHIRALIDDGFIRPRGSRQTEK